MSTSSTTAKGTLIAAVGFDAASEAVFATANSLATRFGMQVRLVHVVEPPLYDPIALDMPGFYTIPPVVREAEEQLTIERRRMMDDLVKRFPKSVAVTGTVIQGDPPRALIAEATACRANLLLSACDPDAYRLLPSGFSTALTLMHDAPLPVLIVNGKTPLDFSKPGFGLLVADDLLDGTREAARKAYELAALLERARVRQVHVHGDFREIARDTWRDVVQRTPLLRTMDRTPESIWNDEYNARLAKLGEHGQPFRAKAEKKANATVAFDVRTGKVDAELHAATVDFKPDLLVFGRHRTLRARPFLIGRMPFRAMLHEQHAVLIVPPAAELYARLPFPAAEH